MNQFKKVQVIMLPTKEAKGDFSKERIYPCILKHSWMFDTDKKGKIGYYDSNIRTPTQLQHLYITIDDKIEVDNYVVAIDTNIIFQVSDKDLKGILDFPYNYKKIITTTDTSLIEGIRWNKKHPLPQPSQQFIEKYIESYNKGEVITNVLVEYENKFDHKHYDDDQDAYGYDIYKNILKINSKDNTITIKKLKDSWSREEVEKLTKSSFNAGRRFSNNYHYNDWIKENL